MLLCCHLSAFRKSRIHKQSIAQALLARIWKTTYVVFVSIDAGWKNSESSLLGVFEQQAETRMDSYNLLACMFLRRVERGS